jgi:hypothetical protein
MRNTSVIYITTIISLVLIGIGYGFWSNELDINVDITTGSTDIQTVIDNTEYGDLKIDAADDGRMISFKGEVYPDFNEDVNIVIRDAGTVPLKLNKIEEVNKSEIAELYQQKKDKHGLTSFFKNDVMEIFNLKINTLEDKNDEVIPVSTSDRSMDSEEDPIQRKINGLYDEIFELKEELKRYDNIEHHEFRYELQFIQGI